MAAVREQSASGSHRPEGGVSPFDPAGPGFLADPYPAFAALRARPPSTTTRCSGCR
ncbi:hypothetical protein ACVGVM_00395 [Pseudonocardia bannensis]|uniref:Uncharacterized protein n=1 Tax=Pseudonocardia bannensis TaxID=630973 RepID=A0A848DNR9_9PSEU|nr:hypothetical protein [Pseudonocardia bannensis]NMH93994.1 hypothetical protein [Pseudonocardia bannensis]